MNYRKPHTEPMLQAIKKLGEHPSNILSLGDDAKDIISSMDGGIVTIGCLWGVKNVERLELIKAFPTFLAEDSSEALSSIQFFFRDETMVTFQERPLLICKHVLYLAGFREVHFLPTVKH